MFKFLRKVSQPRRPKKLLEAIEPDKSEAGSEGAVALFYEKEDCLSKTAKQEVWLGYAQDDHTMVDMIIKKETPDVLMEVADYAQINHPNMVKYIESFVENGILTIIVEHLDEGALGAFCNPNRPWGESAIAYVCEQVGQALKSIHDMNNFHGGITSDNIFINRQGQVKVTYGGSCLRLSQLEIIMDLSSCFRNDIQDLGKVVVEMAEGEESPGLVDRREAGAYGLYDREEPRHVLKEPDLWSSNFTFFIAAIFDNSSIMGCSAHWLLLNPFIGQAMTNFEFAEFIRFIKNPKLPQEVPRKNSKDLQEFNELFERRNSLPSIFNDDDNESENLPSILNEVAESENNIS